MTDHSADVPVRREIVVRTGVERAFQVFTDGIDSWWPRTHHIGTLPMKRNVIEPFAGGRCYSEQEDGTDYPWGRVIAWEPPRRLVLAWQITHEWAYQPDPAKASEVEVRFTPQPDGSTLVALEHRRFDRMGPGAEVMRQAVQSTGGWGSLLEMFAARAEAAG